MLVNSLPWSDIIRELGPYKRFRTFLIYPNEIDPLPNNQYREDYAWMYAIEKNILYIIEKELSLRIPFEQSKLIFGVGGCFSEAMSNAFVHGNQKDPCLPLSVGLLIGNRGLGFSIKDSGNGFNVEEINYRFKHGQPFFMIAGNGFKQFSAFSNLKAGYSEGGSRLNLLIRLCD